MPNAEGAVGQGVRQAVASRLGSRTEAPGPGCPCRCRAGPVTPNKAQAATCHLLLTDLLKKQIWENSYRFLTMSSSFLFPNKGVQGLD